MSKSKYQQKFDEGRSLDWDDLLGWEKEVNEEESLKAASEYKCGKCGKSYRFKIGLNLHIRAQNCEETLYQSTDKMENLIEQKDATKADDRDLQTHESEKLFKCRICGKTFRTEISKDYHERNHTSHSIKCGKCGKELKTLATLKIHSQIHETGKSLKCRICFKSFKTETNKYSHERLHTAPTVKCGECGKESKNQATLRVHLKTHEPGMNFKCRVCGKAFKTDMSRYQHERIHKDTAVKCETCGKELKNRVSLYTHMRKVHSRNN
jgi:KRAB domain-containing zinc finger protein